MMGAPLSGPALLMVLLVVSGVARTQEIESPPANISHQMWFYRWQASLIGWQGEGVAGWLPGPDGAMRLEVSGGETALAEPRSLVSLQGEGQTIVLNGDLFGTRNPWGEAWQRLRPAEGLWLRLVADVLGEHRPSAPVLAAGVVPLASIRRAPLPRPFFAGGRSSPPARWRFQLPGLLDNPGPGSARSFRGRLTSRGLGRGGHATILTVTLLGAPARNVWRLTTSRLPGWVELERQEILILDSPPPPEAFVPLWPLAESLDLPPGFFGN